MYLTNIPIKDTFSPKALSILYECFVLFFPREYNVLIVSDDSTSQDKLKVMEEKLWKKLFLLTEEILGSIECSSWFLLQN